MLRVVETKNGKIEGLPAADPRITSFKGIPFAKPPVGDLRFHAPVPADKWNGVLKAYNFAPIAVQPTPYYDPNDIYCREWSVDKNQPMSEDCLYLNVWTPAKETTEKLPVYVWIYGGGWQTGFTAEMEFDGERIARRGIVVVTMCYRLNMFGFMCHPEITAENPEEPANFGLLDQRMAMEWVKENIAAFGGDPSNITIGGQSAGGGSVLNQIAYGTNGKNGKLYNRAVVHSGLFYSEDNSFFHQKNLQEAEQCGVDFFNFIGAKNLKEARKIDTETLRKKWEEYGGFAKSIQTWIPVRDEKFVKYDFLQGIRDGQIEPVPLIIGHTTDEFLIPAEKNTMDMSKVKDALKNSAKLTRNKDVKKGKMIQPLAVAVQKYQEYLEARNCNVPNYYYEFDVFIPGWDKPGTFHSVDLWFWFETLAKCWRPFVGQQYDASRKMCNYLCNFIKNGNPNGKDVDDTPMANWENFTLKNQSMMSFHI